MASSFSRGLSTFMQCFKAPAIKLFTEHLQANPGHFDSLLYRGTSHSILGNPTEAIRDYETAAKYGNPCEKLVVQGLSLQKQGKHSDAATLFEKATKLHPNNAMGWHFYGINSSDTQVAVTALKNAIKLNYRFSELTHYFLGKLLIEQGKRSEAIDHFRRGLSLSPTCTVMHIELGGALMDAGSHAEAKELLLKALELNDTQIKANLLLANLYTHEKNHEEAAKHLSVYLERGGSLHDDENTEQQGSRNPEQAAPASNHAQTKQGGRNPKQAAAAAGTRRGGGNGGGRDGGSGDGSSSDDDEDPDRWPEIRERTWKEKILKRSLKKGKHDGVWMHRIEDPNKKGSYIWVSKDTAKHAGSGFKVWRETSRGNKLEFDSSYDHLFRRMTGKNESNAGKIIKVSDMNFS